MQTRNSDIDAVKGLGIALVVLGHNWFALHTLGPLFRVIFSFHMPLFFFLSGIFLNENTSMQKAIHSKSASLLKPYFVILILLGVAKYVAGTLTSSKEFDGSSYFLGVVWSTGVMLSWPQMWFLTNLFLGSILSLVIIKVGMRLRHSNIFLLGISLTILFAGISTIRLFWHPAEYTASALLAGFYPGLPWSIDLLPITCSFALLGFFFRNHAKSYTPNFPLFLLAACVFALLHIMFKQTIDLNLREFGDPVIASVQALLGIYLVFGIATLLSKFSALHALVSYIGSASLFVLIFHYFIQWTVFNKIVGLGGHTEELAAGVSLVLGIIVPVLLWEVTKRQRHLAVLLLPVPPTKIPRAH